MKETSPLVSLAGGVTFLVVWTLLFTQQDALPDPHRWGLWAAVALGLELLAVRLTGQGWLSAAPALVMAAALDVSVGAGWATGVLWFVLGLRWLRGGGLDAAWPDVVAAVLSLAAALPMDFGPRKILFMVILYTLLQAFLRRWYRRTLSRRVQTITSLGLQWTDFLGFCLPALALGSTLLAGPLSWRLLTILPLLAIAPRIAARPAGVPPEEQRERAGWRNLESERKRLEREANALIELTRSVTLASSIEQCLEEVVRRIHEQLKTDSIVFFLEKDEQLHPVAFDSPYAQQLKSIALTGAREPLIETAWRTGAPALRTPEDEPVETIFRGERASVAMPAPQGVVYLGRKRAQPFTEQDLRFLSLVAGQASLAVQSIQRLEAQRRSLSHEAKTREELETRTESLSHLLENTSRFATNLSRESLLEHLEKALAGVAPTAGGSIRMQPEELRFFNHDWGCAIDNDLDGALEKIRKAGRPLLFERLEETAFAAYGRAEQCLAAVPLFQEGTAIGGLFLWGEHDSPFLPLHVDLFRLVGHQFALTMEAVVVHQEVVEAYRKLRESEAQLAQSSKMNAVGQLAAGIAHELNTPLGTILLAVQSAQRYKEECPEPLNRKLDLAAKEASRAREIISKLLYYSRDARVGQKTSDLNRVVEDTLELLGFHLRRGKVEVDFTPGDVDPAAFNQNEVQQVLTNLVLNARDALEPLEGWHRVEISTRQVNGWIEMTVADNGPGIPNHIKERVFEPFFTTKPVGKGVGLGLSVCRQIIVDHGGDLQVGDSQAGGAQFTVRLPASQKRRR